MSADAAQAAITWLESISSVPSANIRTNLPDVSGWAGPAGGFVQVTILPSAAEIDYPVRITQAQLDFWAVTENSHKPNWARTSELAEEVLAVCHAFTPVELAVTSWVGVPDVAVMQASALTEPNPIRNDPNNFARHTMDVQLTWR